MVVKPDGHSYDESCLDILLDDSRACTLYATCYDRQRAYRFSKLKLTGDLSKACCRQ
jgi:hypothetical protein